jgi:uncharacterized repeat protein (TIGR01451 family)
MQFISNKKILSNLVFFIQATLLIANNFAFAATAPVEAIQRLSRGESVDLIVQYDAGVIEKNAASMRSKTKRHIDDDSILRYKAGEYRSAKNKADQVIARSDVIHIKDYQYLPMSMKRFTTKDGLNAFLANPSIKAVFLNEKLHYVLAESLPLIGQPSVAAVGTNNPAYIGSGTTVAVIDGGIDINNPAFGSCTAVNAPASCHVIASNSFAVTPETNHSHGDNVAGIVLGVAPNSKIAALNVFDNTGGALVSDIISAINWAITNRTTFNIVAINMSLAGSTKFTTPCTNLTDWSVTPILNAKNAGILVAAASGNSLFTDGLSSPACAPAAISVGAVYDSNVGPFTWPNTPNCTDSVTSADKVTCFSNSANYLTMLAPGAFINAAGFSFAGTSQASPHVAGAVAVLRSAFPNETLTQTQSRLTTTGTPILDTRNNITKPRLNLLAAAAPPNDLFINRTNLSGASGSAIGVSLLGSKEVGEPNHASNVGGSSVWWSWTAPSAGQLSLNTTGSNFDTLLAVYTGSNINALTLKAANDNNGNLNTSSLVFQAVAGTQYQIAIDGANGVSGTISLNWTLNTNAQANLSSNITGPTSVSIGGVSNYILNVNNAGPQSASNVIAKLTIPSNASLVSAPTGCSLAGNIVSCSAGTLGSGSSQSFAIPLIWNSVAAGTTINASVSSDVPDSQISNNNATLAITLSTSPSDADIPTLPEWAIYLMTIMMLFISLRKRNQH